MTRKDYFLSNVGFTYGAKDYGRDEVEFELQHYSNGVKPGVDYIFQPRYPQDIWQVNGQTAKGAKAAAYVVRGFSLLPNRIDVTCEIDTDEGPALLTYNSIASRLISFFKAEKSSTGIEEFTKFDGNPRLVIGTRKSRFSLMVEVDALEHIEVVRITWNIRREKVLAVWSFIESYNRGASYYDDCSKAFAACTNSILKPDFFGFGLYPDLFLPIERKEDVEPDWWGEVAAFCQKIVKRAENEKSMFLVQTTFDFIEKELGAALVRKADKHNQLVEALDRNGKITI